MNVTLYKNGKEWKTFKCNEIDITTGDTLDSGALFLIKESNTDGITIDAETPMIAEFGENQITLSQPVSVQPLDPGAEKLGIDKR